MTLLHLSGCEQDSTSGSYDLPTAILSVRVDNPGEAERVRHELGKFARTHRLRLDRYPADLQRPPVRERVEYSPRVPNLKRGFSVLLLEMSPTCFVILFSENSRAWTNASLRAFNELHDHLYASHHKRVRLVVRPKRQQNWAERQRTRFEDPEWPSSFDHACSRENESARDTSTP